jgi:hypothetical protein
MQYFYFLFGAVTIAAAIQGAIAGSMVSLIAGGLLGVAGKFVPDFLKKGYAIWPAGVLGVLGVIGVVLTLVGFFRK